MSRFTDYLAHKNYDVWVEMAIGDIAKNPILFNQDDIKYLYHFPPRFWAEALEHRYDELLLAAKAGQLEGNPVPDRQEVKLPYKNGFAVFNVNTRINKLVSHLERDPDKAAIANMEPGHEQEYRDKDMGGHYGYDLSGVKRVKGKASEFNITSGYKPIENMSQRMTAWRNAMQHGWLGDTSKYPRTKVSFGAGRSGAIDLPVFSADQLRQMGFGAVNEQGEVTWHFQYEDEKGNRTPQAITNFVPVLFPGKHVWAKQHNNHADLLKKADQADEDATSLQAKAVEARKEGKEGEARAFEQRAQQAAQHASNFRAEAGEIVKNADRHTEFGWNVHRHNTSTEVDPLTGKESRKYPPMNTNIKTLGGFVPNKGSAGAEASQNVEEDLETLQHYLFPTKRMAGGNPEWFVWGPQAAEAQAEIRQLIRQKQNATSGKEKEIIDRKLQSLDQQKWIKNGPIVQGIMSFMNQPDVKLGTVTYTIMMQFLDDMINQMWSEVKANLGAKVYQDFIRALDGSDTEKVRATYDKMAKSLYTKAVDFAHRVHQLNWGDGTRRRRGKKDGVDPGVISLYQAVMGGENEASMLDLISSYLRPSEAGDAEGSTSQGQRKNRYAGGIYGKQIYFGHSLQALKELEKERESEAEQGHTYKAMDIDGKIRGMVFDYLKNLYIATQWRKGNFDASMDAAEKYADQHLVQMLQQRGVHISHAPKDLVKPDSPEMQQQKAIKQHFDKIEILSAVGDQASIGHARDFARASLFDQKTMQVLAHDKDAWQRAWDILHSGAMKDLDPEDLKQYISYLQKIRPQDAAEAPQQAQEPSYAMAAKDTPKDDISNVNLKPLPSVVRPEFIQKMVDDERAYNQVKSMANDPGLAPDFKRQVQQALQQVDQLRIQRNVQQRKANG